MKKMIRKAILALAVLAATVVCILATTGGLYFAGVLNTTVVVERDPEPCPASSTIQALHRKAGKSHK